MLVDHQPSRAFLEETAWRVAHELERVRLTNAAGGPAERSPRDCTSSSAPALKPRVPAFTAAALLQGTVCLHRFYGDELRFERGSDGEVVSLVWGGRTVERRPLP